MRASLDATEDQLDFPHMYASGRNGWADAELDGPRQDLTALFNLIVNHVPEPKQIARQDEDFRMLATTLGSAPFVGRILTGRVESGRLKVGATLQALSRIGQKIEQFLKKVIIMVKKWETKQTSHNNVKKSKQILKKVLIMVKKWKSF